jgi:hypothetical protein
MKMTYVLMVFLVVSLAACKRIEFEECKSTDIVILDRTTRFDSNSKMLAKEGIDAIMKSFGSKSTNLYAFEIGGSALSYKRLAGMTGIEAPVRDFVEMRCTASVFDDSFEKCRKDNEKRQVETDNRQSARQKIINDFKEQMDNNVDTDFGAPDSSISYPVVSIVDTYCGKHYCTIFLFSDLIEEEVRNAAHSKSLVDDKELNKAVERQHRNLTTDSNEPNKLFPQLTIFAWGVGRDERALVAKGASRGYTLAELPPNGKDALRRYWDGLIAKSLPESSFSMSFRFPMSNFNDMLARRGGCQAK